MVMRYAAALLVLGAAAVSLRGQYQAVQMPPWQDAAQKANDARAKGRRAEAELIIEKVWADVQRAGAGEDYFPAGVQSVVNFYDAAGRTLKANTILHAAEAAVAPLPEQHPNRLAMLTLKAQTYQNQGRAIEAQAIYEQVLPLQVKIFGEDSFESRGLLEALAHSYDNSGELEKAEALFRKLDGAEARVIQSEKIRPPAFKGQVMIVVSGRIASMSRAGFAISLPFPAAQSPLGEFCDRHGRFAEAEKAFQEAIASAERDTSQNFGLVGALGAYESYLERHRRYREAQQVEMHIIQVHDGPAGAPNLNHSSGDHVALARLYVDGGQFEEANKVFDQVLSETEASTGRDTDEYRNLQMNYAFALMRQKKFDAAEKIAREIAQNAPANSNDYARENALNLLAQIRGQAGDHQGAEAYRARAAARLNLRFQAPEANSVTADLERARALLEQHKIDQAWSQIDHALGTAESAEPYQTLGFLNEIAGLGGSFPPERGAMADQLMERIAAVQDRTLSPADPLYNPGLVANYYQSGGRWAEAERRWSHYIQALEEADGPNDPRLVQPLLDLANLFRRQNRSDDSLAAIKRALNIQEKTKGPNSGDVSQILGTLAQLYFDVQNETAAMEAYERQIRLSRRISGRALPDAQTLTDIAQAYAQHREFDRAIELATEALDIASQPEYAEQVQFFRNNLEAIQRQKAAALQAPNPTANKWFNTDRFARPGGTHLYPSRTPAPNPQ